MSQPISVQDTQQMNYYSQAHQAKASADSQLLRVLTVNA